MSHPPWRLTYILALLAVSDQFTAQSISFPVSPEVWGPAYLGQNRPQTLLPTPEAQLRAHSMGYNP